MSVGERKWVPRVCLHQSPDYFILFIILLFYIFDSSSFFLFIYFILLSFQETCSEIVHDVRRVNLYYLFSSLVDLQVLDIIVSLMKM